MLSRTRQDRRLVSETRRILRDSVRITAAELPNLSAVLTELLANWNGRIDMPRMRKQRPIDLAAPDLLDACRSTVAACDAYDAADPQSFSPKIAVAADLCRAAIAKAELPEQP